MSNSQGRRREIITLDEFQQYSGANTQAAKNKSQYLEDHHQHSEGGKTKNHSIGGNSVNC
jgi:hypothetical protein